MSSLTEFKERFDTAYQKMKETDGSLYAFERFISDLGQDTFCISDDQIQSLRPILGCIYNDRLEGSDKQDRVEAAMILLLDLAQKNEPSTWPEKAVNEFKGYLERAHEDAYLLYLQHRQK